MIRNIISVCFLALCACSPSEVENKDYCRIELGEPAFLRDDFDITRQDYVPYWKSRTDIVFTSYGTVFYTAPCSSTELVDSLRAHGYREDVILGRTLRPLSKEQFFSEMADVAQERHQLR